MEVHSYFLNTRKKHPLHLTLLDPGKMDSENLSKIAKEADQAGTDGIMVGGSTDLSFENVEQSTLTLLTIKPNSSIQIMSCACLGPNVSIQTGNARCGRHHYRWEKRGHDYISALCEILDFPNLQIFIEYFTYN